MSYSIGGRWQKSSPTPLIAHNLAIRRGEVVTTVIDLATSAQIIPTTVEYPTPTTVLIQFHTPKGITIYGV